MSKIIGRNEGFKKEKEIIGIVNNKRFEELPFLYKPLIEKMFYIKIKPYSFIKCYKNEGKGLEKKTDLTFEINNKNVNTSIKLGHQNSIHQEPLLSFLDFLDNERKLSQYEINLIKKFHWCDGTLDNYGSVGNRKRKTEFKKLHPFEFQEYLKLLRSYKHEIFTRVWKGHKNPPEYLIYFNNEDESPNLIDFKKILEIHMNYKDEGDLIGILRIQNWNACLKGQDHGHKTHKCDDTCPKKSNIRPKHRQDLQFKSKDIMEFL